MLADPRSGGNEQSVEWFRTWTVRLCWRSLAHFPSRFFLLHAEREKKKKKKILASNVATCAIHGRVRYTRFLLSHLARVVKHLCINRHCASMWTMAEFSDTIFMIWCIFVYIYIFYPPLSYSCTVASAPRCNLLVIFIVYLLHVYFLPSLVSPYFSTRPPSSFTCCDIFNMFFFVLQNSINFLFISLRCLFIG